MSQDKGEDVSDRKRGFTERENLLRIQHFEKKQFFPKNSITLLTRYTRTKFNLNVLQILSHPDPKYELKLTDAWEHAYPSLPTK